MNGRQWPAGGTGIFRPVAAGASSPYASCDASSSYAHARLPASNAGLRGAGAGRRALNVSVDAVGADAACIRAERGLAQA